jgi:hypothetical protein
VPDGKESELAASELAGFEGAGLELAGLDWAGLEWAGFEGAEAELTAPGFGVPDFVPISRTIVSGVCASNISAAFMGHHAAERSRTVACRQNRWGGNEARKPDRPGRRGCVGLSRRASPDSLAVWSESRRRAVCQRGTRQTKARQSGARQHRAGLFHKTKQCHRPNLLV